MYHFYYVFVVLISLDVIKSAPIRDDYTDDVHDQRQNGTENYRIDMKDVLIVFSPLDSLVAGALAAEPDKPDINDLNFANFGLFDDLKHAQELPKQNRNRSGSNRLGNLIKFFIDRRRFNN